MSDINNKVECEACGNKFYVPLNLILKAELQTKDAEIDKLRERNEIDAKAYAKYSVSLENNIKTKDAEIDLLECKNLTQKNRLIELLTKCVDSCEEYGFVNKCQGCKNSEAVKKYKGGF